MHKLETGRYTEQPRSDVFPFLPMADLSALLAQRKEQSEADWIRALRKWLGSLT